MMRYTSVLPDELDKQYVEVNQAAQRIWDLAQHALRQGEADYISDAAVRRIMTAAVKLYAVKVNDGMRTFRPLEGTYDEVVTPTEALTAATEILRALKLGPVEFGLWSRRRPGDFLPADKAGF
jgi:hypothetical protein